LAARIGTTEGSAAVGRAAVAGLSRSAMKSLIRGAISLRNREPLKTP
jgi:hypothetical protein